MFYPNISFIMLIYYNIIITQVKSLKLDVISNFKAHGNFLSQNITKNELDVQVYINSNFNSFIIINTYFEQMSSGQNLRKYSQECLQKILRKFKPARFETYLTNLEQLSNLSEFIGQLWMNSNHLDLTNEDISSFLSQFGKNQMITDLVGVQFYTLWLEFFIICFGDVRERLKPNELEVIPKDQTKQLEFIKSILISYVPNFRSNMERECLQKLLAEKYFKDFISLKLKSSVIKSRLSKIKSIDQSDLKFSNLKISQAQTIFKNLLENIDSKIGDISIIQSFPEKKEELKQMFNEILQSNNELESQLLYINLKKIIRNYLGITINRNRCILEDQQPQITKQGFINLKDFKNFQNTLIQFLDIKISIEQLLVEISTLLERNVNVWYWPTFNDKPFITLLINSCIEDGTDAKSIVDLLERYPPSVQTCIFNSNSRIFLTEVLIELFQGTFNQLFANCFLDLCIKQRVNLKNQQIQGETLEEMFRHHNINKNRLEDYMEKNLDEDYIFIYDIKSRRQQSICINKQHTSEFIDQTKSQLFVRDSQLNYIGYSLTFTMNNQSSDGIYKSGSFNKLSNYTQDVCYQGVINYGKIAAFGKLIKKFSFKILEKQTWKFHELSPNEQEMITDQILSNKNRIYSLKLQGMLLEFNFQTFVVRNYEENQKINSMIKQDFGYLIYIPAHKIDRDDNKQKQIIGDQDINFPEDIMLDSQNPQKEQKSEKIVSFGKQFPFLGVFASYFDKQNGYQIDKQLNVLATDQITAEYFNCWKQINFFQIIESHLQLNNYANKGKVKNSFKISKALYFLIRNEFRDIERYMRRLIVDKWVIQSADLMIVNMIEDEESRKFIQKMVKYYELLLKNEKDRQHFVINLNEEQHKYLQNKKDENIKIVDKQNKKVEIFCTKQEKQKLLFEIEILDEVHQFIYLNPAAFALMKEHDEDFLENLSYKYTQIDEQKFKIAIKIRDHPKFKTRFQIFSENLAQIEGQRLQLKIEKQGQFIHLYMQQLSKYEIQVSKMGIHILIEYDRKFQKMLKEILKKIADEKVRWIYEYVKKSSSEISIRNIKSDFMFELKNRLQAMFKQKAKNQLLPIVEINQIQQNEFSLKVTQIDKQIENLFIDLLDAFSASYKNFLKIKKQIVSIQKYLNECFSRLPNQKMNHRYEKTSSILLKQTLRKRLLEKIVPIYKQNVEKLENGFLKYIRSQDLMKKFNVNVLEEQKNLILTQIKNLNIFTIFMEEQIQKCQNSSKVNTQKSKIFRKMKEKNDTLFAKFNNNQLKAEDLTGFFKSLSILGKIYYGDQLPITQHLEQFENLLKNNNIVLVKAGTGSGKSTVIPPYLIGLGYSKVVVTQPRRLPCRQIFKRIESVFGAGIAGYQIGDDAKERGNSLIYTTDGMLKAKVLFNESQFDKIDVLVIDQIHERSANIDMLMLFLNQYYRKGNKKLKLVLCSATIDKQISKILSQMNLKIANFEVSVQMYPVSEHKIEKGTMIDRVLQICRKLKADEQMLVFYPGVREVNNVVQILREKYNRQAFPIYGNQSPIQQSDYLKNGQIFIATAIAQTSLTFRKLKYVIDSRVSRWMSFNCKTELMETVQEYSSNSSIQQRKGRLGRTCPGQYHYFVYHNHDFVNNREHNTTQLEKVDITNYIFQFILRKMSFQQAVRLLSKLNQNKEQFDKKISYSQQILSNLCIISGSGNIMKGAQELINYGDLGSPQHNSALYEAHRNNCLLNMVYLVSFFMMGMPIASGLLDYLKPLSKGSDLKVIHDFLIETGEKINLRYIESTQILVELKKNCPLIYGKPWCRILFRVLSKANQLLKKCINYVPSTNWNDIMNTLLSCYRNKVFFNQSLFGGNKSLYEKYRKEVTFDYESDPNDGKIDDQKKIYQLNHQSLIYNKGVLPNIILSMSCVVNPLNQCILSICEVVEEDKLRDEISVAIHGFQCQQKYFKANDSTKDERAIFKNFQNSLNGIKATNKFPVLELKGSLNKMITTFRTSIEPERKNAEIRIDMNLMLNEVIENRKIRSKYDSLLPVIDPETSKKMFLKLTFANFKEMFLTTKYDMQNNYGVIIEWEIAAIERYLVIKNAKNMHLNKLIIKLYNFFRWFADSQMICSQDFKISPRFIEEKNLSSDKRLKIMDRVNSIVDSRIEHYVIKGWVNGKGPFTKYPRTARMIATCWVLVNKFNCVVKGGFVRDWVVNGEEVLPAGDQSNLLKKNNRNKFLQVIDDSVTPSDIDAQLSSSVVFADLMFKKEMARLGIQVKIEEDGWRKHVIFDEGKSSGGFTADLIEPYTSICHDSYDFDVNTMYIMKDHLNAIGLKIPLEYIDNFNHKTTKISLQQLILLCQSKQMRMLKYNIPTYRFDKFKKRGWKINDQELYQPICYKSLVTQSSPVDIKLISKISKAFEDKMINTGVKAKIVRIQSLKNKSWDETFQSIQYWIISELENEAKAKDPNGYYKTNYNSNNALLFHGTKFQAYKGIKEFGFDSRYFGSYGYFGRGAYFADDPMRSHEFTSPDSEGNRYMFIVKVALGNQEVINLECKEKLGPSKGFHSIYGTGRSYKEYIIQRWGQAKPLYLITYK